MTVYGQFLCSGDWGRGPLSPWSWSLCRRLRDLFCCFVSCGFIPQVSLLGRESGQHSAPPTAPSGSPQSDGGDRPQTNKKVPICQVGWGEGGNNTLCRGTSPGQGRGRSGLDSPHGDLGQRGTEIRGNSAPGIRNSVCYSLEVGMYSVFRREVHVAGVEGPKGEGGRCRGRNGEGTIRWRLLLGG